MKKRTTSRGDEFDPRNSESLNVMDSGYHKIIDAKWTPKMNLLVVRCGGCDAIFNHRSDRWTVRCPRCGKQGHLARMREEYADKNSQM